MKPIWHIDGSEVLRLQGNSPDFVRIVNSLLAMQAADAVPDAAIHLNVKDSEPDGGVDAVVDQAVLSDQTGFLGVPTCWQYKAEPRRNIKPGNRGGGQEAALRAEVGKPHARELIAQGYGYRLCIADDMPDEKKEKWEVWLTDEARKINRQAPQAKVVTASDLARWVNRYPAVVAAEFRPFLGDFRSVADWHREFRFVTPEFVAPASWAATADLVRRHIESTQGHPTLTVQGEAGVGKSRAVCEALVGKPAWEAVVVVTSDERSALEFARVIAKNREFGAILVADDCSLNDRVDLTRIAETCADRLRVLAIDNSLQREGGVGEIRLGQLASEDVNRILERNFRDLPEDRRRAYSELARGFVRLAVDLCRHDLLVPPDGRIDSVFGFFHDNYLKRRLKREELEAIEVVSLLPRVGYREDVRSELVALCGMPLVGLRAEDVVKAANKLKQAPGFIAFAGRYLYVTPTLIGQVAFQGAWHRWIAPDPATFLSALPEPFIASFLQRVQSAGTGAMKQTVSDFFLGWAAKLGPPGLGSEETVLRLVRLIEVHCDCALPILRGLLEQMQPDELRRLHSGTQDGQQARRQLVWLAEKLSYFRETFADAEIVLLRLAVAETEPHLGNSASRLWAALFRIALSGTPIPFPERLALLEKRLRAADAVQLTLALDALDEIVTDGLLSRLASPPVLFGRIPPPEWRPVDQAERRECLKAALEMAARVVNDIGGTVADGIRAAVVRRLSTLLLGGFLDEAKAVIGPPPLPDATLIEVVRELEKFLDVFCREHDALRPWETAKTISEAEVNSRQRRLNRTASIELETRVREWYRSLIPGDLHGRIVSVVGQEYWHQQLDGDAAAWQLTLNELAEELIRSPTELQRELGWLCSPHARSGYRFGQALAGADRKADLLDQMLWDVPRAGGTVLARGYLERVTTSRPDLLPRVNAGLDRLQAEVPKAAFDLVWSAGDEVRKVERLFAMVDRGGLPAEVLRGLGRGVQDRQLREDEVLGAIDRLLRSADAGNERAALAAVHLLHGWLHPDQGALEADCLRTRDKVREVLLEALDRSIVGGDPSFWMELVHDLCCVEPSAAVRLLAKALGSRDSNVRALAEATLMGLAPNSPATVMEAIGESALSQVSGWVFRVEDFSKLLEAVPEDAVRAWLERAGREGARALARHLPAPVLTETGEPRVPPLTAFVLSRYEDDDVVFREFTAGTHAGQIYSSDFADRREEEAQAARRFLGHPLKRVREWAAVEIDSAKRDAQFWREREQEIAAPQP